jgi:hypothetical protein
MHTNSQSSFGRQEVTGTRFEMHPHVYHTVTPALPRRIYIHSYMHTYLHSLSLSLPLIPILTHRQPSYNLLALLRYVTPDERIHSLPHLSHAHHVVNKYPCSSSLTHTHIDIF